jgi:hypothetical protein
MKIVVIGGSGVNFLASWEEICRCRGSARHGIATPKRSKTGDEQVEVELSYLFI